MTALAEALLAAQRQAIGALSKAYVAEATTELALLEQLDAMGCTDKVEQAQLISALDVLHNFGTPAPAVTPESRKAPEQATEAQRSFIAKLCKEANQPEPDVIVSKEQASKIIEALKAGTYNAGDYDIPF